MKTVFELREKFTVTAGRIYNAWLDSEEHTKMTGAEAICSNRAGGDFTAWEGYISGKNTELIPGKKITQTWRTSEFDDNEEDSELIIELLDTRQGCELTLIHKNIPEGHADYKQGWIDHYFNPMKLYFKG